jgi:lipopolysaccharide assembly protein B
MSAAYAVSFFSGLLAGSLVAWLIMRNRAWRHAEGREMRRRLFKGADLMLEERWEEAAREFSEFAPSDSKDEDLYFVLGRLYRRGGDIGRAARIHQGLLARRGKQADGLKLRAGYELAKDFRAAGQAQRAYEMMRALVGQAPGFRPALASCLELAVLLEDWERAVNLILSHEQIEKKPTPELFSYVASMRALQVLREGEIALAKSLLGQAAGRQVKSALLSFAQSKLLLGQNKPGAALKVLKEGLEAQPFTAPLMLDEMRQLAVVYGLTGDFDQYLNERLDSMKLLEQSTRVQQAIRLYDQDEPVQAREIIRMLLEKGFIDPQLIATAQRMGFELAKERLENGRFWTCSACGEKRLELAWFCTNCASWNTYFPEY